MPKPVAAAVPQLKSWSFSRFIDYDTCPARFKYKHLLRLQEPGSPAMERGSAIHKLAEEYVLGRKRALPKELAAFGDEFRALKAQKFKTVEADWSFKKDWSTTNWDDWNGCWLRVKLDASYLVPDQALLKPIDFKTGKYRDYKNAEYLMQLELYAIAGLIQVKEAETVAPELWYVDEGRLYPNPEAGEDEIVYERKELAGLKKKWEKRVVKMFADRSFNPKPGRACTYCHYRKTNGGPCKY